ncbi:hypothetical protein [Streptococcus sp. HMSC072C09]|uniref:hypothetical protein n=1 Tax=Streptococcus sp. HMSC072C09 TaxID=1739397 RepID=UPI0008A53C05|nr:hypothetical protein [Streptococcus sp. HMSC072C09]OFR28195.1 hypothetical protein HMPREF2893_09835 [Streptococcus sp. HMSC072C09]
MELEDEVQGMQDQAQKIIEMPQRDQQAPRSETQSSASVVSLHGQERPSVSSLHQQLASASGTQTIQLREELVLAVAQNASAQATVFEAEVKDKLEEAKETVSHKVAEVSQMAHSMAQFLTDAEVEQLLGGFSMDTCWDQAVEAENLAQAKAYSTRLSDLAGQLEAASAQLVDLDKGQATAFDFS